MKIIIILCSLFVGCAFTVPKKVGPESSDVHPVKKRSDDIVAHLGRIKIQGGFIDGDNIDARFREILNKKLSQSNLFRAISDSRNPSVPVGAQATIDVFVNNERSSPDRFIDTLWYLISLTAIPSGVEVSSDYDITVQMPYGSIQNYKEQCSSIAYHSGLSFNSAARSAFLVNSDYCMTTFVNKLVAQHNIGLAKEESIRNGIDIIGDQSSQLGLGAEIQYAKNNCSSLGFESGTTRYGDCVLQLLKKTN
jgi:hypothetical protein